MKGELVDHLQQNVVAPFVTSKEARWLSLLKRHLLNCITRAWLQIQPYYLSVHGVGYKGDTVHIVGYIIVTHTWYLVGLNLRLYVVS